MTLRDLMNILRKNVENYNLGVYGFDVARKCESDIKAFFLDPFDVNDDEVI